MEPGIIGLVLFLDFHFHNNKEQRESKQCDCLSEHKFNCQNCWMNDLQSTPLTSCSIYLFSSTSWGISLDGLENHFCLAWDSICLCVVVFIHKSENRQCFSMLFPRLMTLFLFLQSSVVKFQISKCLMWPHWFFRKCTRYLFMQM